MMCHTTARRPPSSVCMNVRIVFATVSARAVFQSARIHRGSGRVGGCLPMGEGTVVLKVSMHGRFARTRIPSRFRTQKSNPVSSANCDRIERTSPRVSVGSVCVLVRSLFMVRSGSFRSFLSTIARMSVWRGRVTACRSYFLGAGGTRDLPASLLCKIRISAF